MNIETSKSLSESDILQIHSIWNAVYPTQVLHQDVEKFISEIKAKLNQRSFICRDDESMILGWLMCFDRDNERYIALLVKQDVQNIGIGSSLIKEMQKIENHVVGWVVENDRHKRIDGTPYRSPISFYKRLGFELTNERLSKNDLMSVKIKWQKYT